MPLRLDFFLTVPPFSHSKNRIRSSPMIYGTYWRGTTRLAGSRILFDPAEPMGTRPIGYCLHVGKVLIKEPLPHLLHFL